MTNYRFELLDDSGHVSERRYLECDGKAAAVDMAGRVLAQAAKASGVDIWDGAYLIKCLKKARPSSLMPRPSVPSDDTGMETKSCGGIETNHSNE